MVTMRVDRKGPDATSLSSELVQLWTSGKDIVYVRFTCRALVAMVRVMDSDRGERKSIDDCLKGFTIRVLDLLESMGFRLVHGAIEITCNN